MTERQRLLIPSWLCGLAEHVMDEAMRRVRSSVRRKNPDNSWLFEDLVDATDDKFPILVGDEPGPAKVKGNAFLAPHGWHIHCVPTAIAWEAELLFGSKAGKQDDAHPKKELGNITRLLFQGLGCAWVSLAFMRYRSLFRLPESASTNISWIRCASMLHFIPEVGYLLERGYSYPIEMPIEDFPSHGGAMPWRNAVDVNLQHSMTFIAGGALPDHGRGLVPRQTEPRSAMDWLETLSANLVRAGLAEMHGRRCRLLPREGMPKIVFGEEY